MRTRKTRRCETIVKSLPVEEKRGVIPTTFVPLAPDKIAVEEDLDVLFGLFHIMWSDMPKPMTYRIRLAEYVTPLGEYSGCCLKFGFPSSHTIKF